MKRSLIAIMHSTMVRPKSGAPGSQIGGTDHVLVVGTLSPPVIR